MFYEKSIDRYTKKFILISDSNFTIPPLSLKYYNQHTKDIDILRTNAFNISINTPITIKENNLYFSLFIYFCILTLSVFYIGYMIKIFDSIAFIDKKSYFKKQLKKTKNKEELLKKVVPYLHTNRQLMHLIYKLEMVESSSFKKLKKEILTHF